MKLLPGILFVGLAVLWPATAGNAATLLTFDSLPTSEPGDIGFAPIPDGYGGLDWGNFGVLNGLAVSPDYGYHTGVVSPDNVAFNLFGSPASISISAGEFDLDSAYLTLALNLDTPLNIQVEGFRGTTLLYNNTYTEYSTAPGFVNFDYLGVDRVTFITSPPQQFAMDNLTVIVPEPGAFAIMSMTAALGAFIFRRRRQ
jgi:hypothetical protein